MVIDQPAGIQLDRVAARPFLEQRLRDVAHVVVGPVPVHAHRLGRDQRRPLARAGTVGRDARDLEHGLDVVAVDAHPREPVGLRASHGIDGELELGGRRVGKLIVLEDEDDRQAMDGGEVHRLVPLPVRRGALAEECHRHPRLRSHLEGQRDARRDQGHVRQHADHPDAAEGTVSEVHVAVPAAGDAALAAHVVSQVSVRCHPPNEMSPEIAVQDARPIPGPEGESGADTDRLLASPVVEGAGHLALLVEGQPSLFGEPLHQHVAEEQGSVLARQRIAGTLAPGRTADARGFELHMRSAFPCARLRDRLRPALRCGSGINRAAANGLRKKRDQPLLPM